MSHYQDLGWLPLRIWWNYAPIPNSVIFFCFTAFLVVAVKRIICNTKSLLRSHLLMNCICLFMLMLGRISTQFVFEPDRPFSTVRNPSTSELLNENKTINPFDKPYYEINPVNNGNVDLQFFVRCSLPMIAYSSKMLCLMFYGIYMLWRAEHPNRHVNNVIVEVPFWIQAICFVLFGVFKLHFLLHLVTTFVCFMFINILIIVVCLRTYCKNSKRILKLTPFLQYFAKDSIFMITQNLCSIHITMDRKYWEYSALYEISSLYSPILDLISMLFVTWLYRASDLTLTTEPTPEAANAAPPQEIPLSVDGISNRSVDGSINNKSISSGGSDYQDKVEEHETELCAYSVSGFESHTEECVERRTLLNQEDRLNKPNIRTPPRNYVHRVECEVAEPMEPETMLIRNETKTSPVRIIPVPEEHPDENRCESTLPVGCYIEETAGADAEELDNELPMERENSKMSVSTESLCSIAGISGQPTEVNVVPGKVVNNATHSSDQSSESDHEMEKIEKPNAKEQDRVSLDSFVYYD